MTRSWRRRALAFGARLAAAAVIALALLVGAFRVVEPLVPGYRADAAAWAAAVFEAPVDIGALDLRWRGLRPELVLERVRFISADARRALAAREIRVGLSLVSLFSRGRLAPARIVLVEPDVTLVLDGADDADPMVRWQRAFDARGRRGVIVVEGGRLTLLADGGRRRVEFSDIDGRMSSDGLNHTLRADASPGAGVDGRVHVSGRARGWPGQAGWQADARAELSGVDLVALQRLARHGRFESGVLDLAVELEVARGTAQRLEVEVDLIGLRRADDGGLSARLLWQRRDGGWDAVLRTQPGGSAELAFTEPAGDAGAYWALTAENLVVDDLALVAGALSWQAGPELAGWLARNPRGVVETGSASWRHGDGPQQFTMALAAHDLALDAAADSTVPGFAGVALELDAGQQRGRATVSIDRGSVHFPRVFRRGFVIDRAEIVADWSRDGDGWRTALPRIVVRNGDLAASGHGSLERRADETMTMALDIEFDDADLAANHPYLPVAVMSPALVDWLDRAVVGGHADDGVLHYAGALRAGALQDGSANLLVEADIAGVELEYSDGWPRLRDANGHVRFTGRGFDARLDAGAVATASVRTATVAIPDYGAPELAVAATAGDDFATLLAAFQRTPVGGADWLRGAAGTGNASLTLKLGLPLHGNANATVDGAVVFDRASLSLAAFPQPLTDIRGTLAIHADGADAGVIHGRLLDEPVTLTARTLRDGEAVARAVEVRFGGEADAGDLARLADRELSALAGRTAWQARLLAPYGDGEPVLEVESDLAGLAIDLPAPLGKPAAVTRPTLVRTQAEGARRRVFVDAGAVLQAIADYERGADGWSFARGSLHLGPGAPAPLPARDLAISGFVERWSHAAADALPTPAAGPPLALASIAVEVGTLELFGRSFGRVAVDGHRADSGWHWIFEGAQIAGSLDVPDAPDNDSPIRADFERLIVGQADPAGKTPGGGVTAVAASLPPIAFHSGRLDLGRLSFGEVNGLIRQVENGVALDTLTATRREARITADGSWHTVDGYHRTVLRATIDSTDVRETLAALGYAASIEAEAGHLQADLNWLGSPLDDPLPLLNGSVGVRLERGTLMDVEAGAGRVFGLLSLYALPRRLALDFSDVFRRGLAFDTVSGNFRLEQGQAYTDDLQLAGPALRIEVSGRTGLATRDYDQQAEVTASLASSLTLAGALVGGPGVGAAMLIASELFKGPLEDIARVRYRLRGTWDAPEMERIEPVPRESP